jgi:hypothetical protein
MDQLPDFVLLIQPSAFEQEVVRTVFGREALPRPLAVIEYPVRTKRTAIMTALAEIKEGLQELKGLALTPAPVPPSSTPPDFFDLVGVAAFLGCTKRWLRDNCKSLGIGHERIGRGYRFTLHELERYLSRHRRKGKKGVYEA